MATAQEDDHHRSHQLIKLLQITQHQSQTDQTQHQISIDRSSLQTIQDNLNINTNTNSVLSSHHNSSTNDRLIANQLKHVQQHSQSKLQQLTQQFSQSQIEINQLKLKSKQTLIGLQNENNQLLNRFLSFEDHYLDHIQSINNHSPNLDELIQEPLNRLNQLQLLKLWLTILSDLTQSITSITSSSQSNQKLALENFFRLVEHYQLILTQHDQHDHQINTLHLSEIIQRLLTDCLRSIIGSLTNQAAQLIENELQWPSPNSSPLNLNSVSSKRVLDCFTLIAQFQTKLESRSDLVTTSDHHIKNPHLIYFPLLERSLILRAVLQPIILRFRFHFDSQRSTNRLDKPEWYFNHILDRLSEHESFVTTDLQQMLDIVGQSSINAFTVFSTQLIRLAQKKLTQTIPQILEIKPILAHTIEKSIEFDQTIRQRAYCDVSSWSGTVEVILGNPLWFGVWFEAEKKFVEDRVLEIISSNDMWELNEEDQAAIETPMIGTKSSTQIQETFEMIKLKYENLRNLEQQRRFFEQIQMEVLKDYLNRINGVLDGFDRIRRVFKVRGESNEFNLIELNKLCLVFDSCFWIVGCIKNWNDDLFYLELDEKIKKISYTIDRWIQENEEDERLEECLGIFKGSLKGYEDSLNRCESLIIKQVQQDVFNEFNSYLSKRWDFEEDEEDEDEETVPDELKKPLHKLIESIKIINLNLKSSRTTLKTRKIIQKILNEIEKKIIEYLIEVIGHMNNKNMIRSIGYRGGNKLKRDFKKMIEVIKQKFEEEGMIKTLKIWNKSIDCFYVLSLRSKFSNHKQINNQDDDNDNDKEEEEVFIEDLIKVCFNDDDNDSDNRVQQIRKMGVKKLDLLECQKVLKRRSECWKSN